MTDVFQAIGAVLCGAAGAVPLSPPRALFQVTDAGFHAYWGQAAMSDAVGNVLSVLLEQHAAGTGSPRSRWVTRRALRYELRLRAAKDRRRHSAYAREWDAQLASLDATLDQMCRTGWLRRGKPE